MKFLMTTTALFLSALAVEANEGTADRVTGLFIAGSQAREYLWPSDDKWTTSEVWYDGSIQLDFQSEKGKELWSLRFWGANTEKPCVELFKQAKRGRCYYPDWKITDEYIGSNQSRDQFEILELEYDEEGKVKAFAANFIQRRGHPAPPLFGRIRIKSSIPVEPRFTESAQRELEDSNLCISKLDPLTGRGESIFLELNPDELHVYSLSGDSQGVEVVVEGQHDTWVFDFSAPMGSELVKGIYKASDDCFFYEDFKSSIVVKSPYSRPAHFIGVFEVVDIQRTEAGDISKLILEFIVETELGETYQGTIRHSAGVN
jgi:hypothetical protein